MTGESSPADAYKSFVQRVGSQPVYFRDSVIALGIFIGQGRKYGLKTTTRLPDTRSFPAENISYCTTRIDKKLNIIFSGEERR